jgi:hypothetical protein
MSDNQRAQQVTERRHIEEFLRLSSINATVEYRDGPDAVALVDGRRIGIEHTELTEPELAAGRREVLRFEDALTAELARLGVGANVCVSVGLNTHAPQFRNPRQVTDLVVRVARFAAECAARLGEAAKASVPAEALRAAGFPELAHLSVGRKPERTFGPLAAAGPGAFWGPGAAAVRAAVKAKERRLGAYKASGAFDEVASPRHRGVLGSANRLGIPPCRLRVRCGVPHGPADRRAAAARRMS